MDLASPHLLLRAPARCAAERALTLLRAAILASPPLLLSALSGLLYTWAAPRADVWPLAFVCWVPFLLAIDGKSPRQAAALGLLQGMATSVAGTFWLVPTVEAMAGWGRPLALAGATVLWLFQGSRGAALGWLAARAARRGWSPGLAFGLSLAAVEVAYPMLFGWYAAIQVHTVPLLMQAADLGGPIAVSVALAGANVLAFGLLRAAMERKLPDLPRLAAAALLPAFLIGYGALRLRAVDRAMAEAPTATVGVVQAYVGRFGQSDASVRRSMELSGRIVEKRRVDLLVWPEGGVRGTHAAPELSGALPAFVYGDDGLDLPPILTGIEVQDGGPDGPVTNDAVLLDPSRGLVGRYVKNHLVPFGEYIPFGDAFPVLHAWIPNAGKLKHGDAPTPIPFGDHLIATLICYEDTLPAYTDAMMAGGRPDLLVDLNNDVWFGKTGAAAQHFALSKLRAVEHHRFLVRAGNIGVSAIVDAAGRVTQRAPSFVAATITGEIAWMQGTTIYERIGDAPWWLAAIAILAMGAVRPPRRRAAHAVPPARSA